MRQHKGYSEHTKELALGEEYLCRIKKGKARELKKPIKLTLDHLLTYNLWENTKKNIEDLFYIYRSALIFQNNDIF